MLWLQVHTSAAALLFLAPALDPAKCKAIQSSRNPSAAQSTYVMLQAELEALWPKSIFSADVNIIRRAFINRLGSRVGIICE